MIQKFELFNENVENPDCVGFFDYLSEEDQLKFNNLRIEFVKYNDLYRNVEISKFINKILKKETIQVRYFDPDGRKLRGQNVDDMIDYFSGFNYHKGKLIDLGSRYPNIIFFFPDHYSIEVLTKDFCNDPNKCVKIKKKTLRPDIDPFGEEDWED